MGSSMALDKALLTGPTPAAPPRALRALVVNLAYREVLVLEGDRRGMPIAAGAAPIWITQEGDPDDYVLQPGERLTVDRPGRVVMQGMRSNSL